MYQAIENYSLEGKKQNDECLERRTPEEAKRILIVDDEEEIRNILFDVISFMGFDVTVAHNGDEGLSLFLGRAFDLVLTDFQMPGLDGSAFAKCIKRKSPDTPVVLITGEDRETVRSGMEEGSFDAILFKPFNLIELEEIFQRF